MANQPTIVVANLDDAKLKASIDKMVNDLNIGLNKMTANTDAAVAKMQASLQSVGNIKFGSNGDSSKQVQKNNKVTQSVNNMTAAYDSFLSVLQKSGRTESGFIKNFNAQDLATLKFALRDLEAEYTKINREGGGLATEKRSAELRNQISLVDDFTRKYETAYNAMSKVGDNQATSSAAGKFAKEWTESIDKVDSRMVQLRRYFTELERASNKEIRIAFADAMKMPTRNIDEIVDKLMALQIILQHLHGTDILSAQQISAGQTKINELIASLERELQLRKEINSEGQRDPAFVDAIRQYRDGIRAAAEEARNFLHSSSVPFLYTDTSNITGSSYSSKIYAENDARSNGLTIEEQILQVVKQKHEAEKQHLATQQQITGQIQQQAQTQQQGVNTNVKKTFAEYEDLRSAIAAVLQLESNEVTLSESQNASYKALSLTLKQLTAAYENLGAESRKSENAGALLASLHEVQRAMQEIRSEMLRPTSLQNALGLPETTLDDITYKIKMLRAYAQGVNTETSNGQSEITKISDTIDVLSEKVKNLQKTTKQTVSDTNSKAFETIAKKQEDTIGQVGAKIKELKSHLNDLRKQPVLDDKAIKRAEDALEKLYKKSQKLNDIKPTRTNVNKALKMSEKSLDEIAQKIQRLSSIRMYLNVGSQKAEIEDINKALERLRLEQSKILGQNKDMLASNNALVRSFNYMKNRLAFYFTVGASTQFVKSLIDIRSQYEMNERALGILINSAERGTQIFKELSEMSLVSPYTLIELSSAAKQLVAYDVAARDVVDTTRRLADMASAVGVPMERLTYALGQIKAYGYLNSRDARMFANAGIPLVKQLADYYTELEGKMVSTADVYDRMKKKAIDYNDVMAVVTKMTDEGGKFFDFQAKMADTLKVRLANLTLAWNNMLNEVGESHQGILTGTLGVLKNLFLHWKDISSIINNLIISFGLLKVAQIAYLAWSQKVGLGLAAMEVAGRRLTGVFYSLGASLRAIVTNPLTWWFALISIGVSMFQTWSRNVEEIKKLNKAIADGAQESADAMLKMMQSAEMVEARIAAKAGKLSYTEGNKAFERIREQIELSAISANDLIPTLLHIPDINERITKSFELAESIQAASDKLSDLYDKLDMSQDTILGGLFGEGLVEDIEDYSEHMKVLADNAEFAKKNNRGFWESLGNLATNIGHGISEALGNSEEEATVEITKFATNAAKVIKDELGEEGLKDKIQVGEAVARVVKEIEQQYPKISGSGKKLFETLFNETMSNEFKGAFDKNAYYYNVFLQQLKKDFGSAFRGITDSVVSESYKWSKEQQIAIDKTIAKMKKDMPDAAQETIGNLKNMLKNEEFRLRFVAEFATATTDFQKEFETRVKKLGATFESMLKPYAPLTTEELPAWTKKQQEAIANLQEENKKYEKDNSKFAKDKIAANKAEISNREKVLDLFNQSHLKDKELNKQQRAAESELQKALKEELQLIEKVRSNYKSLTKEGASHTEAIATAIDGYDETVGHINKVLGKYGIGKLDLSKFAGIQNPRELVNMLEDQVNKLLKSSTAKPEEIKELQVKVQKLKVEAKTYDLSMITKGLKNELGKVKDEYELALELDANPELGGMFADMFGINVNELPRTFGEALDRAQTIVNRKLSEMNISTPFDLMHSNMQKFTKMSGLDANSEIIKELTSAQKVWQDMFKKNITETEKMLDDYIKKYGDYSDKIAEIEADRLEKLKKLNEAYYTEEMRKLPEYAAKMNAINQGAQKEKQQVDFDEFKNSRYYTMMFENLDYISTKTIRDMRDRVRDLIDTMNDLTPEQLKTLISQYEKLEQKLVKRSPFKTLTKDVEKYFATTKERKAANVEFKNAQKEYDAQKKNVAALKEKYEQAKANSNTSKSYLDFLRIEIDGENEILRILKEQLDAAQKKADKYNLTAKLAKSEALQVAQVVGQNLQSLGELRDFLQQDLGVELSDELNGLVDGLSKVGQGINKITSSATSGDIVGVITGVGQTIYGLYDGIASLFGGGSAADKKITKQIQDSERAVKRLELAYIDLKHTMDTAYGSAEIGAQRAIIVNKELQLAELKRQLQLEQSRKAKYRDEDRILELRKQIRELEYDIVDSINEITNSLLGISSVGNAAETLVSNMITAFKKGEQFMDEYKQSFDDMIDNMIMKAIVSNVIGKRMQELFDRIQKTAEKRASAERLAYEQAAKDYAKWQNYVESGLFDKFYYFDPKTFKADRTKEITKEEQEKLWKERLEFLKKQYEAAMIPTPDDVQSVKDDVKNWKESVKEEFMAYMDAFGIKYGQNSTANLSSLQQGLQGMSESTAGALEAYMNNVSQQVYLQSDLLTQIRDAILGFDVDIQTATLGQILLQLQASYQVQQSIQMILEGVLVPSGRAFAVELIS